MFLAAMRKVCATSPKEGSHTLMPVSPIEEKAEKGLSRSGETEEAEEDRSLLGHSPAAMEEEEGKEGEEEVSCEGRKSVGRKSPKEPTKVEKEEHERTQCPYRSWCEHCVRARARNGHHRRQTPEEPLEEVKACASTTSA